MLVISLRDNNEMLAPVRAHEGDAGLDLRSNESVIIHPGSAHIVDTGMKVVIPYGYVGLAFSRSGHGKPEIRVRLSNSVGVIDHQYRGFIQLSIENNGSESFCIRRYDRIGQLAILPVWLPEVSVATEDYFNKFYADTKRGSEGFGSTGKQ